jgi:hypothetical protein
VPEVKDCKGYEPSVSLTLSSNTTIKYIKNFRKFYLNYHHDTSLEYEHIIIRSLNHNDSLLDYNEDSTVLMIGYSLHI